MCHLRKKLIVHHTTSQYRCLPLLRIVGIAFLILLHIVLMSYRIVIHATLIRAPANNSFSIILFISRSIIKSIHIHIHFFLLLDLF